MAPSGNPLMTTPVSPGGRLTVVLTPAAVDGPALSNFTVALTVLPAVADGGVEIVVVRSASGETAVVPVAYKIYVTTVPGVLAVTVISGNETGDMLEAVTVQVVLYKSDYRRVVNDYNLARLDQGPVDGIPEGFIRYPTRPAV